MDWRKILTFETMISPLLIQILFWAGVLCSIAIGFSAMVTGSVLLGLGLMLLGPLIVRVYAELVMVIFKINEGIAKLDSK